MIARGTNSHWTQVAIRFVDFIVNKIEEKGLNELAFRFKTGAGQPPLTLDKCKSVTLDRVVQFLRENHWTIARMTALQWFTDRLGKACYGKQTNNYLKNTKGVYISPYYVFIAYMDHHGGATRPYIYCAAGKFVIRQW